MPAELSQLMQLASGHRTELFMGDLPRPVAKYLRSDPGTVYLGHDVMMKIVAKHVKDWEPFQLMPLMIGRGEYYKDPLRPNCVTVIFSHPETTKLFLSGLKAAANGNEVWVQTIYRTAERKLGNKRNPDLLLYKK